MFMSGRKCVAQQHFMRLALHQNCLGEQIAPWTKFYLMSRTLMLATNRAEKKFRKKVHQELIRINNWKLQMFWGNHQNPDIFQDQASRLQKVTPTAPQCKVTNLKVLTTSIYHWKKRKNRSLTGSLGRHKALLETVDHLDLHQFLITLQQLLNPFPHLTVTWILVCLHFISKTYKVFKKLFHFPKAQQEDIDETGTIPAKKLKSILKFPSTGSLQKLHRPQSASNFKLQTTNSSLKLAGWSSRSSGEALNSRGINVNITMAQGEKTFITIVLRDHDFWFVTAVPRDKGVPNKKVTFFEKVEIHPVPYESRGTVHTTSPKTT